MDNQPSPTRRPHHKTIPIRKGNSAIRSATSIEGTFIPLPKEDSECLVPRFMNPKFMEEEEDDDEEIVKILDLETEEKPPLYILFPDLDGKKELFTPGTSTTQVTRMLIGKRADFSLLKPSRRLNHSLKLPPLIESRDEKDSPDNDRDVNNGENL